MSVDLTADDALSFSNLVTLEEDLEPYVLEWPSVPDADGASQAVALVVMKRAGDFFLVLPPSFVPEAVYLARANAGQESGPVGASTSVLVPGVIVENGIRSPAGSLLEVVLVNFSADLVSQTLRRTLRCPSAQNRPSRCQHLKMFCERQENELLEQEKKRVWPSTRRRGTPMQKQWRDQLQRRPSADAPSKARCKARSHSFWWRRQCRKAKENHNSVLGSLSGSVVERSPALSSQLQTLTEKQQLLESRVVAPSRAGALGLSQPLSLSLAPMATGAREVAQMVATPPPRTR